MMATRRDGSEVGSGRGRNDARTRRGDLGLPNRALRLLIVVITAVGAGACWASAQSPPEPDYAAIAADLTKDFMSALPEPPSTNAARLSLYLDTYAAFYRALRAARAGDDVTAQPAGTRWDELRGALGIDDAQAAELRARIDRVKDRFFAMVSLPAEDSGPSPAAQLREWARTGRWGESELQERFVAHLRTARPAGQTDTYIALVAREEEKAREALRTRLAEISAAALQAWEEAAPGSLLDVDTGHNPLADYVAAGRNASK